MAEKRKSISEIRAASGSSKGSSTQLPESPESEAVEFEIKNPALLQRCRQDTLQLTRERLEQLASRALPERKPEEFSTMSLKELTLLITLLEYSKAMSKEIVPFIVEKQDVGPLGGAPTADSTNYHSFDNELMDRCRTNVSLYSLTKLRRVATEKYLGVALCTTESLSDIPEMELRHKVTTLRYQQYLITEKASSDRKRKKAAYTHVPPPLFQTQNTELSGKVAAWFNCIIVYSSRKGRYEYRLRAIDRVRYLGAEFMQKLVAQLVEDVESLSTTEDPSTEEWTPEMERILRRTVVSSLLRYFGYSPRKLIKGTWGVDLY